MYIEKRMGKLGDALNTAKNFTACGVAVGLACGYSAHRITEELFTEPRDDNIGITVGTTVGTAFAITGLTFATCKYLVNSVREDLSMCAHNSNDKYTQTKNN